MRILIVFDDRRLPAFGCTPSTSTSIDRARRRVSAARAARTEPGSHCGPDASPRGAASAAAAITALCLGELDGAACQQTQHGVATDHGLSNLVRCRRAMFFADTDRHWHAAAGPGAERAADTGTVERRNCWQFDVDQSKMEAAVAAMSLPRKLWDGSSKSLIQLGYTRIGIDEGWEECAGVPGPKGKPTYHDAQGSPIINNSTFPDMKALVNATAAGGGVLDWYLNNCGPCPSNPPGHIEQDVAAWAALGFGGTKVDGCDVAKNISEWYEALLKTGKPFLLDQCDTGWPAQQQPTREHCPYHTFRTSNDISPTFSSVVWNIQSILPWIKPQPHTISGPNCWAQPDMLEVGNTNPPNGALQRWGAEACPVITHAESEIHFGLWCVTSAPLVIVSTALQDVHHRNWRSHPLRGCFLCAPLRCARRVSVCLCETPFNLSYSSRVPSLS